MNGRQWGRADSCSKSFYLTHHGLANSTDRITALVAGCVALAGQAIGERK